MGMIGESDVIQQVLSDINTIGRTDASVLIMGPTGSGKELIARALHNKSGRSEKKLITVNCAALPENLLESELFGYVRGAFTGANENRKGKFQEAAGGTILLDEIGEMPPSLQAKLLRFLESGEIQQIGANRSCETVNVRVITSTNAQLQEMIRDKTFRKDLYYRLDVCRIIAPPLSAHLEDMRSLIHYFEQSSINAQRDQTLTFTDQAWQALLKHSWPGNVRELKHLVERLLISQKVPINHEDLAFRVNGETKNPTVPKVETRNSVAKRIITQLDAKEGNFWELVRKPYMNRELTNADVRALIDIGLRRTMGNYRIVTKLFNMERKDYAGFLNFLRKHDCLLPFRDYRGSSLEDSETESREIAEV